MKLNPLALALTAGIICGVAVMLATWWVLLLGSGGTMILIKNFYFGYSISFIGGIIGLIWGFVDGFIIGFIFATLYNRFSGCKTTPVS
jgi:hypothetical protein